jgi:hypothetical protein
MESGMMGYDAQWNSHPWMWIGEVLWFLLFAGLALALAAALTRDRVRDPGREDTGGAVGRSALQLRKRDMI